MRMCIVSCVTLLVSVICRSETLRESVQRSGVKGGLVVCVGWSDAEALADARLDEHYVAQGLSTNLDAVLRGRLILERKGISGPVSIVHWDGTHLPYAENLVNLIVLPIADCRLPNEEIERVLTPRGVALRLNTRQGERDTFTKSVPSDIDEWTHYLHGPDNNAVAEDTRVGPPRRMQWAAGPRWSRSHDHMASVSTVVSSGGRVFYIVDEGPIASVKAPPKWMLVARDAFNGVLLWKKPIPRWEDTLRPFRSGPMELPRRLVAKDDRVYVTLGYGEPVTALEAATGEVRHTYAGTDNTHEILLCGDSLYLVVSDRPQDPKGTSGEFIRKLAPWTGRGVYRQYVMKYPPKRICRVDIEDGKTVWTRKDENTRHLMPSTLAVSGPRVFFENEKQVVAMDRESGKIIWRAERPLSLHRPAFSSPTLVVQDGVVLSGDRSAKARAKTEGKDKSQPEWLVSPTMISTRGQIMAFAADTGKLLWSVPCHEAFNAPVDILVAHGKVWSGYTSGRGHKGITEVYALATGEVVDTRPSDHDVFTVGFAHGRCHRNKATTRYVVHGRAGVEMVDMSSHDVIVDHWVRGTCQYGFMPCNGLLYAPPHSCACYNEAKLNNFNVLAPAYAEATAGKPGASGEWRVAGRDDTGRLLRGAAYGSSNPQSAIGNRRSDWPTYRGDAVRSGVAGASLSSAVKPTWSVRVGEGLTPPVVAEGRLIVARRDANALHALNAADGASLWTFVAGGRIDSPPTVFGPCVYFGSADGHVYCLRAADGALAWRYRLAPEARQVVSYGRPESAWPVHGSVLVHAGSGDDARPVVYAVAGRSSFLDGGLFLHGIDARTGEQVFCETVSHRDPKTGREPQETIKGKRGTYMPGALPDILSSDGKSLFMRHTRFDMRGKPQPSDVDHLFCPDGFADDNWWHRTYWMIGKEMLPDYHGWPYMGRVRITGRLLVTTEDIVYGFGRETYEKAGSHLDLNTAYRLFAARRKLGPEKPPKKDPGAWLTVFPGSRVQNVWSAKLPFFARAMVLAGDTLFAAGPGKVTDFAAPDPKGGVWLQAVSAKDGKTLAEHRLEAPPVFDGMAASDAGLFFVDTGGTVRCYR